MPQKIFPQLKSGKWEIDSFDVTLILVFEVSLFKFESKSQQSMYADYVHRCLARPVLWA